MIAFPTRELFVDRINDFDLIILDRYQRRSVLPLVYFENIADYVRRGGALLVAAGPEFADTSSIAFTALADILPAYPTGSIAEEPFGQGSPTWAAATQSRAACQGTFLAMWRAMVMVIPAGAAGSA